MQDCREEEPRVQWCHSTQPEEEDGSWWLDVTMTMNESMMRNFIPFRTEGEANEMIKHFKRPTIEPIVMQADEDGFVKLEGYGE